MKPNATWFKDHGWKKTVDETSDICRDKEWWEKRHQVTYEYYIEMNGKRTIHARWDHITYVGYKKGKLSGSSGYYMFSASNSQTNFQVTNRIYKHPFTTDQIKAAMLVVGVVM